MDALRQDIKDLLVKTDEGIITTRLDNDDCVHNDFMITVQQQFQNQRETLIEIENGYCLQIDGLSRLGLASNPLNQFISLIERCDSFKTVKSRPHKLWTKVDKIVVSEKRLWCQITHDKNVLNKFSTAKYIMDYELLGKFGLANNEIQKLSENRLKMIAIRNFMLQAKSYLPIKGFSS